MEPVSIYPADLKTLTVQTFVMQHIIDAMVPVLVRHLARVQAVYKKYHRLIVQLNARIAEHAAVILDTTHLQEHVRQPIIHVATQTLLMVGVNATTSNINGKNRKINIFTKFLFILAIFFSSFLTRVINYLKND